MLNEYVNIDKRRPSIVSEKLDDFTPIRKVSVHEPATFEEAITATEFGKFNIILAAVSILVGFTIALDTGSMSYASLAAQCDLHLTLSDKGILNAVVYAGMVTSATVWGIASDTWGRKKVLIVGLFGDFLFIFMSFLTQNLTVLIIAKYLQGVMVIGPFATINAYLAEFLSTKHRPKFLLMLGASNTTGTLLLPVFAWIMLPLNLNFNFWNMQFHSWNFYLLITGLPALVSGFCLIFFPESPKFLMSRGKNEKALEVFRKVYRINTGKPADSYPIKKLINDTLAQTPAKTGDASTETPPKSKIARGFHQMKPLFHAPHLRKIFMVCLVTVLATTSLNMLRLWLPQIFQAIGDYETIHGTSSDLCTMIELIDSAKNPETGECSAIPNVGVYTNTMIISATSVVNYMVAIIIIPYIGKKKLVCSALTGSGLACISIYFARDPVTVVACAALFLAWGALASNLVVSLTVDMFPTTLRTLAISMGVMLGRAGSVGGNFLFPILLSMGCEPPFFFVGSCLIGSAVVTIFFPKTEKNLQ